MKFTRKYLDGYITYEDEDTKTIPTTFRELVAFIVVLIFWLAVFWVAGFILFYVIP